MRGLPSAAEGGWVADLCLHPDPAVTGGALLSPADALSAKASLTNILNEIQRVIT